MLIRAQALARYGLGQGFASLQAGREAFALRQSYASEKVGETTDRRLLETLVGAGLLAATQAESQPGRL